MDNNVSKDVDHSEKVVQIRRCSCVVKGGRRFSFSALVVVGVGDGMVGYGYAKGLEVPVAVEKAVKNALKNRIRIEVVNYTIPHAVAAKFSSSYVSIMPANPGTGILAGGCIRSIMESVGIKDVMTKCRGSTNPLNIIRAAFKALSNIRHVKMDIHNRFDGDQL